MNDTMREWERTRKWMFLAARLEGLLEAHKILKGADADDHDRLLWKMSGEMIAEANDE